MSNCNDAVLGEPEQDANSALTELDKGLRSGKVGEQCEAIVRFPRLFEKYPFPILINSSFLKLADVFRMGNNFLRLWVLKVCQQSEKHLDKILNVDEFVRRVFSVLHSNDPVARALALRTLGAVAGIIPDRENVHHAIRRGLDSHDDVEVDAAIYATTQFAAHSNAFAVSMCNKLSDMVECETTGTERRAKLVRALRTVHGGAVRAHGVLRLLRSLLERFPSSSSVRAAICALTHIAHDTVVHVPDQVEVLLGIAREDVRAGVRRCALVALRRLAHHAALWPARTLHALVRVAAAPAPHDHAHALLCLQLMEILVKCPAVCALANSVKPEPEVEPAPAEGERPAGQGGGPSLRQYCAQAALSADLQVAATAAHVLTAIALYCYQEGMQAEGAAELQLALESLVVVAGLPDGADKTRPLRRALRCLVQLCKAQPEVYCPRTARVLGNQLRASPWVGYAVPPQSQDPLVLRRVVALLEALCALGGMVYSPESVAPAMPAVVEKVRQITKAAETITNDAMEVDGAGSGGGGGGGGLCEDGSAALVLVCTVVCQERAGAALAHGVAPGWQGWLQRALAPADAFTRYRVAVAALRYGHDGLAGSILQRLEAAAPSEAAQRWLGALRTAAHADHALALEGIEGLERAMAGWEEAAALSSACARHMTTGCAPGCAGCGSCLALPTALMCARAHTLAALARAAGAARTLCTHPPPAIAHAHAQAARDPAVRAGGCAAAVRKAARALQQCAVELRRARTAAIHADTATHTHIQIKERQIEAMRQLMERMTSANYQEGQGTGQGQGAALGGARPQPRCLEDKLLLAVCAALDDIQAKLFDRTDTKPGITHRHTEALLAAVRVWCASSASPWALGAVCWGAGAGGGGGARCRLSLCPAPRPPHDAAALTLPHHLALRIEGVILPAPAPRRTRIRRISEEREVKSVQLTVTATPHPRTGDKNSEAGGGGTPVMSATQLVQPVRDFFSGAQLVSVGAPGVYTVAVEAALLDAAGRLWHTGPYTSILLKAHEDPTAKSTVPAARGRF